MASQRFCLRWNNHQTNLLSVFDQLLHAETFTDVTLAVEGQYLKAHKMVLSACSPYFQQIFVNHPEKHPIVILKDVPYADMKSLLDFMYRGEVSVDQERLTAFLRVAESLRIKGLTEVNDEKTAQAASQNATAGANKSHTPPPNLHRINNYFTQQRSSADSRASSVSMAATNPLLGSALSGQKRKRGRPRKLSGSDVGEEFEDFDRENLVLESPEITEMKLEKEGFSHSGNEGSDENGVSRSINDAEDSTQDVLDTTEGLQRKSTSTPQPASISKNASPRKDDNTSDSIHIKCESSMLPPIIPNLGLLISKNFDAHLASKIRINPMTQHSFVTAVASSDSMVTKSPAHTTHESASSSTGPTSTKEEFISPSLASSTSSSFSVPIITSVTSLAHSSGQTPSSSSSGIAATSSNMTSPGSRTPARRRIRRKGSSPDDQAEQLTEMSVRGLNLFRYASLSEGVYKCTECAKDNIEKTFKNKYSFQRHAFLYHEGTQRKVFPCPVCAREFSRPDKMKNHMKTTHDYGGSVSKDVTFPLNFLIGSGGDVPNLSLLKSNGNGTDNEAASNFTQQQNATMEYLRQQSAENSLQLQMIGFNSALSLQMPKLESLLPTTQ